MTQYALINDDEVKSIISVSSEEEIAEYARHYQAVIQSDTAKVGWKLVGAKLAPFANQASVDYTMAAIYDPLKAELEKIKRQFIGENIFWGINVLGKTKAVGDFMEPIEKWFDRVSPLETITEIEKAKYALSKNTTLAASLTPFVTIERLNWYKTSILLALAKIRG